MTEKSCSLCFHWTAATVYCPICGSFFCDKCGKAHGKILNQEMIDLPSAKTDKEIKKDV